MSTIPGAVTIRHRWLNRYGSPPSSSITPGRLFGCSGVGMPDVGHPVVRVVAELEPRRDWRSGA